MIDYTKKKNRGKHASKLPTQKKDPVLKESYGFIWVIVMILIMYVISNTNTDIKYKLFDKVSEIQSSFNNKKPVESNKPKYSKIRFINSSNQIRKIYWLNNKNNKRRFYRTLRPNQSYVQDTYPHHMWLVTDSRDNELAKFYPKGAESSVKMYDEYIRQIDDN